MLSIILAGEVEPEGLFCVYVRWTKGWTELDEGPKYKVHPQIVHHLSYWPLGCLCKTPVCNHLRSKSIGPEFKWKINNFPGSV